MFFVWPDCPGRRSYRRNGVYSYSVSATANAWSGVGVIVELGEPAALNRLRVSSPSGGWSAKVYVADSAGTTLAEWGRPVAGLENIEASTEFDLGGAKGRAVLLWITSLADDNGGRPSVEVQEITVEGRSDS